MIYLGGTVRSAPAYRAGDLGSNPGPGKNVSLKLTTYDLPGGYSENQIFRNMPKDLIIIFFIHNEI